jgi:hypothetical protein
MAQLRAELRAAREARELNPTPTTPLERMARRADNMAKTSALLAQPPPLGASALLGHPIGGRKKGRATEGLRVEMLLLHQSSRVEI